MSTPHSVPVSYAVMAVRREACALCRIQYGTYNIARLLDIHAPSHRVQVRLARVNERLLFSAMEDPSISQPTSRASYRSTAPVCRHKACYVLPSKVLESFGVEASPNKTDHGMVLVSRSTLPAASAVAYSGRSPDPFMLNRFIWLL